MKKFARKSLAILLAVIMTASVCCIVAPATIIAGDVDYASTSGFHTLSFNPANGYYVMPYSADGQSRLSINNIRAYGAREYCGTTTATASPGAINSAYFNTETGTFNGVLNGSNMTNGKIIVWSEPWQFSYSNGTYYEPLIVFKGDGSIEGCDSNLDIVCSIPGVMECGVSYVNKYSYIASDILYYFDSNNYYGSTISVGTNGRFAIVKKDNAYVNLGVNVPLTGTIQKIVTGSSYSGLADDEFALYFTGTGYFNNVEIGTPVSILATETLEPAKEVMNDAMGFIQNTGYMIKDGVNLAAKLGYIGPATHNGTYTEGHSSSGYSRGWTGMGVTANGTVYMMVSTSACDMVTMANRMEALGCVNAFRMDAGGSSQMAVSGQTPKDPEGEGRAVSEGLVVVNSAMMGNASVKAELGNIIAQVEEVVGSDSNIETLVEAKAAYNGTIQAEQRRYIGKLLGMLSSKGLLGALVDSAEATDVSALSDYSKDVLQTAVLEGKRLVANSSSTDEQCDTVAAVITEALQNTVKANRVSLGAAYKSSDVNPSYPDNGGAELTNGDLYETPNANVSDRWTGFLKENAAGSNSSGSYAEVYVDLGEAKTISAASVSAENRAAWGISAPSKVEVLSSQDGKSFSKYLTLECPYDASAGDQVMFYTGQKTITARYFVFRTYFDSDHIFLGEVSLYGSVNETYSSVDAFNTSVDGTKTTTIFTSEFASSLTASNANLVWCNVAVCDYDSDLGAYVVTGFYQNRGSSTTVSVPSDGFVVAYYAEAGWALSNDIVVGDYAYINGINLSSLTQDVCARIAFKAPTDIEVNDYEVLVGIITVGNGVAASDDNYIRLYSAKVTVAQLIAASSDKNITVTYKGNAITGNTVISGGAVVTDSSGESYTTYIFADVNADNKITTIDYILLKRAYMGTYELKTETQFQAATITNGSEIRAIDYIMLKRYFLGTYELV